MEVITIEKGAFKRLVSDYKEMKGLIMLLCEKVDKWTKTKTENKAQEFITVKEVAYLIKKSRKTVTNYCMDYPGIRRKKAGRENLIHQNDFFEAFGKGRKEPFDRKVFNRKIEDKRNQIPE